MSVSSSIISISKDKISKIKINKKKSVCIFIGFGRNSGYAGGSPINPGSRRSPDRVPSQSSNSSESFRRGNVQALINRPEPTPQAAPRWVCDYEGCGKTFTRGFNLTQHKAAIHRDERRFECS